MNLGRNLHELARLRLSAVLCVAAAVLAAVVSAYRVDLFPPGLEPRGIEIASATAEVLVDKPLSTAVDLRQGSLNFDDMTNRAVLLGNVMASSPVTAYIARRAGVPAAAIRTQAPVTAEFPRPIPKPGEERGVTEVLRLPVEYRISITVDPTVPILRVVAQAPTVRAAETLADASIDGLEDYLASVAGLQRTPPRDRLRLERLGRSQGTVINEGVREQFAILAFVVVLGLSAALAIFLSRVRSGWREARRAATVREPDEREALDLLDAPVLDEPEPAHR